MLKKIKYLCIMLIILVAISIGSSSFAEKPKSILIYKSQDVSKRVFPPEDEFKTDIQLAKAKIFAEKHYQQNAAIISDIDETIINTSGYYKNNKDYDRQKWKDWADKSEGLPKQNVIDFLKWAKQKGYKVFLLTGRSNSIRESTIQNLNKLDIPYDELYMRPENFENTSAKYFKRKIRQMLTEKGYKIIINIGDQQSDLDGGFALKRIKLHNPIYIIP